MSAKIVLCSQCGTKNRLPDGSRHGPVKCGSCGKQLAVGATADSNASCFWPLVLIGLVVIAIFYDADSTDEPEQHYQNDQSLLNEDESANFNAPPVQISHGVTSQNFEEGVAPLGIETQAGRNYFVKVVDIGSEREILTAFIEGGRYFETVVPLGSYELRYASGEVWYGNEHYFGPQTAYSKADQVLNFTFDGYQYSGNKIELILQTDGNLRTVDIDNSEF